jgi:phage terminase large subunit-like protein
METPDLELLTDEELLQLSPYTIEEIVASESLGQCPVIPHRREQEFLDIDSEEVLFGGAVGGGKTEAGMLWLAQGVQYANYSGMFLRRTAAQLTGSPTSPIERSHKFFTRMGGRLSGNVWKFPNGAAVRFEGMQNENDKHNFDGHEFHRIFFDQVEQFSETQYSYLFSRLRRIVNYPIGCGIRSSANPVGGHWVRSRFVSQEAIDTLKNFTAYDQSPVGMKFECPNTDGYFVPSRIADNPSLEVDEYIARLRSRLGGVLAAKLANGDWSAVEGAVISQEDFQYYGMPTPHVITPILNLSKNIKISVHDMNRFAIVDTAGTSEQKVAESKGKPASWSVCSIWESHPMGLFLRHVWRKRVGWPELHIEVAKVLNAWGNPPCDIENAHHGQVLHAELKKRNHRTKLVSTVLPNMKKTQRGAKYERAVASGLLGMFTEHKIWLPDAASVPGAAAWLPEFEGELTGWTGLPEETSDQIDNCSYAANRVRSGERVWGGVVENATARRW